MKKIIKSLILVLIVAMAFVAVPAMAETAPDTYENVYQGDYTSADLTLEGFASIVYGKLNGEATEFGIEVNYYGDSVWETVAASRNLHADAANDNGDFGIALFNLRDGYYAARAFADGVYGEYVYFTVGDSYKANYTIEYYFADANGDYVKDDAKTVVKSGSIGATVTASAEAFAGYVNNVEQGTATGVIAAGDELVLSLYYDCEPYDWATLEMGVETMVYGKDAYTLQGGGAGHYPGPAVNNPSAYSDTSWTVDGTFINFATWQNPEHSNYTGSIIRLPNLDMEKLESITIRYITLNDGRAIAAKEVYLRANTPVTTNSTAGVRLAGLASGEPVETTITKDQLLATMAAGDQANLHTLYIDGYGWTASYVLIDYIRINSTQDEVVAHNANLVTVNTEVYTPNGEGYDMEVVATKKVLKGTQLTATAPEVAGYVLDEDNAENVFSLTADGTAAFKFYYDLTQAEITYDFNGGEDGEGNVFTTAMQYGTDALIADPGLVRDGYTFMGWSATQQTETLTVDADGLVGGDTTFYAVWYDHSWLDFDDLSTATYESIIAGSNPYGAVTYDGSVITSFMKQFPYSSTYPTLDKTVKWGSIALPNLVVADIANITINYTATSQSAWMGVNNVPFYASYEAATAAKANLVEFATANTSVVLTGDKLAEMAGDADVISSIHFVVMSWSESKVNVDSIEVLYKKDLATYTTEYYVATGDGSYELNSSVTNDTKAGTAVTANVIEISGYEFDEDNENNVLSGAAANDLVLKVYYNIPAVEVTYDYNGGTDGAGTTKTVAQLGTDNLISGEGITRDGYVFLGWSTTQQTDTVTIDADGKVGTDAKFYAVWYDLSWLSLDTTSNVYNALTEGSTSYWEAPRAQETTGYVFSTRQCPDNSSYVYGVLRLPNIEVAKIESITFTYKQYAGSANASNYFIAHFNRNMTVNSDTNNLVFAKVAESTEITFTKDQITAACDGDAYLTHMYIGARNWTAQSILIENITINYAE